ncbi:MAG: cell division protein FtsZ [Succinivibrio dextrinosolvens]|uniref:cell division protein FtsZ n=1 Tax=Succinivibrio sp. TaxID=2053619 RepID=UPI0025EB2D9C|nr:cell division protein FtsZ [Succinivibrio sp.]MDY6415913.1 cell division protein FtsZ [Succinivibrio dextrinosolvens]MBQ9221148.1 cell division protein FtsZ [Succinivibrio sp.]MDY6421030.1 cell division protein FtsZ [Succinivibrio dextrinosolvens]MDY6465360.1 cell division protein FtsZ [Succinivibrio dextrinosolvens]MDY6470591.1 cell division protein FtsZ [Succinivibrio dextrinosolvens]
MSDDYSVLDSTETNKIYNAKIIVVGVGGGGCNTIQHMIDNNLKNVEFIAVNTDANSLTRSTSDIKVQIGVKLTSGLGSGCDPNKGRKAAEESAEDIKKLLQGADMIFITAGMGGGTGTGAAPIIAQIAKEVGALTVAVVTKPFTFEGKRHAVNAESGITELSKHVDSLIVIDNDKLLRNLGANIAIIKAFECANDVLLNAVRGITDAITVPAFINLDFADVVTIMRGRGHAVICNGFGKGPNMVEDAVDKAINSPLVDQVDIRSASGVMAYVKINPNFPIIQLDNVCSAIQAYADEDADCKTGIFFDENLAEDEVSLTLLIAGISAVDPRNPANMARRELRNINEREANKAAMFSGNTENSQTIAQTANTKIFDNGGLNPMNNQGQSSDAWNLPPILNSKNDF